MLAGVAFTFYFCEMTARVVFFYQWGNSSQKFVNRTAPAHPSLRERDNLFGGCSSSGDGDGRVLHAE
jgi:hypothetical protein